LSALGRLGSCRTNTVAGVTLIELLVDMIIIGKS